MRLILFVMVAVVYVGFLAVLACSSLRSWDE